MQKLKRYLRRERISQEAFAEKIGVSGAQLSRLLSNKRRLTIDVALRIETATQGKVTLDDLIRDRRRPRASAGAAAHA